MLVEIVVGPQQLVHLRIILRQTPQILARSHAGTERPAGKAAHAHSRAALGTIRERPSIGSSADIAAKRTPRVRARTGTPRWIAKFVRPAVARRSSSCHGRRALLAANFAARWSRRTSFRLLCSGGRDEEAQSGQECDKV
jgi:hypothetical protein